MVIIKNIQFDYLQDFIVNTMIFWIVSKLRQSDRVKSFDLLDLKTIKKQ